MLLVRTFLTLASLLNCHQAQPMWQPAWNYKLHIQQEGQSQVGSRTQVMAASPFPPQLSFPLPHLPASPTRAERPDSCKASIFAPRRRHWTPQRRLWTPWSEIKGDADALPSWNARTLKRRLGDAFKTMALFFSPNVGPGRAQACNFRTLGKVWAGLLGPVSGLIYRPDGRAGLGLGILGSSFFGLGPKPGPT
jgi:hypothetical protein